MPNVAFGAEKQHDQKTRADGCQGEGVMGLFTRLRYAIHMFRKEYFSERVAVEYTNIPPAAKKHFDAAFKQMDSAFVELEKAFDNLPAPKP